MTRRPLFLLALPLAAALLAPAAAAARAAAADAPALAKAHVPFMEGMPFSEALARARREKKPLMVDVFATWCNPCKWMDRTTFTDANVVSWAKANVVPVRIDAEKGEGRRIAGRYAVTSFPTILFLEPSGTEIDRLLGAHGPESFATLAADLLAGKGPLAAALAQMKQRFDYDTAMNLVTTLGQRNDVARLRPIALRVLTEDPDLSDQRSLGALAVLASLEDFAGKLSPETADFIETYLPKIGSDPRRGLLGVVLAREWARQGDVASLRARVPAMAAALPREMAVSDLWIALGDGERKAGNADAAIAAYQKSLGVLQDLRAAPGPVAFRHLEMADVLLTAKKTDAGRAAIAKGLEIAPNDPGVLARAATLQARAGQAEQAVKNARRSVEMTKGEEAVAQAALARALAASGDVKGAQDAWARARKAAPDEPEYAKPLAVPKKS